MDEIQYHHKTNCQDCTSGFTPYKRGTKTVNDETYQKYLIQRNFRTQYVEQTNTHNEQVRNAQAVFLRIHGWNTIDFKAKQVKDINKYGTHKEWERARIKWENYWGKIKRREEDEENSIRFINETIKEKERLTKDIEDLQEKLKKHELESSSKIAMAKTEAEAIGKLQKQEEIALKMLNNTEIKFSLELISEMTGLPVEEISKLKDKI